MRWIVLSILVAVIATLTIQMETAAPRRAPKAARAPAPVTQQFRDAYGSVPKAVGTKSCDRIWCYEH